MTSRGAALAAFTGVALAACGGSARPASTPRPSPAGTATATATPASAATATVAPAATPAPPPPAPLLVVFQPGPVVGGFTADGTPQWSFNPQKVIPGEGIAEVTGGTHLLLYAGGTVAVVDRAGVVVGRGSYTDGTEIHPDPTGTRWAWSMTDYDPGALPPGVTPTASQASGAVWVAGVGEAPHRVLRWAEPPNTSVEVYLWSDRGIVTAAVPAMCAPVPQETSTAILDPGTGRSTPLLGGDRHVVDVHAGLVLAMRQPETLLVTGAHTVTLSERPATEGEHLQAAGISPGGGHVFGSMTSESGCGGNPEVRTVVVDAATQQATVLAGIFADAWYDDAHLVVHGATGSALRIVDLDGNGDPAPLTHGTLVGVLR